MGWVWPILEIGTINKTITISSVSCTQQWDFRHPLVASFPRDIQYFTSKAKSMQFDCCNDVLNISKQMCDYFMFVLQDN
jgi:hypothetical protein